ncbi:hypothetical protein AS361_03765 [Myroides marinus]|uniref:hypothetical protein n=1 Tax=Myroides marinus TaxID=703342 RepID=UPI00074210DE|nr:hypothetical protein [Myroides marinus]KUF38974.1 hypothetical protein AS361_03765 [Myroides marinus]
MTKEEARVYLNDLIDEGKLKYSVYDNEVDFEEAIEFVSEKNYFNYEEFVDYKTIATFGIWRIEKYGLVADEYSYYIAKHRFWETRVMKGQTVWDWSFHMLEKDWGLKNINDFNIAFFFCQDYFKEFRPTSLKNASTAQTLYIQRQKIEGLNEYNSIVENKNKNKSLYESYRIDLNDPDLAESINKIENFKVLKY